MKTKRYVPITERKQRQTFKKTSQIINRFHLQMKLDGHDSKQAGIMEYQLASLKGGSKSKGWGASGSWLATRILNWIRPLFQCTAIETERESTTNIEEERPKYEMITMLDVGAINGEVYTKYSSWLQVESIDLNSQSCAVLEQDFMERPYSGDTKCFHVVCLSLVINFVCDPTGRGEMLRRTRHFLIPKGILYLVLPLPCVTNSRYLNHQHLQFIMQSLGFHLTEHHFSKKLAFYIWMLDESYHYQSVPKKILRNGAGMNNFAIVLPKN